MADVEKQVSLDLYTKANEENVNLRAEVKNKDTELAQANEKIAALQTEKENVVASFAKGAKILDDVIEGFSSRVSEGNPENFFSVLADLINEDAQAKAELEKKLGEAMVKIEQTEAAARTAAREAKIDALLGVAEMHGDEEKKKKAKDKKDKMMAAVKDLTDEQFDALYEVWAEEKAEQTEAAKPPFPPKKDGEDKEDEDKKKDAEGMRKGKASEEDVARSVLADLLKSKSSGSELDLDELIKGAMARSEPSDEENLMALLDNVQASEQAPSAGEEAPVGVDLRTSFGGLVNSMLGHDEEDN